MKFDRISYKVYMWEEENGGQGWLQDVYILHLPLPSSHVLYDPAAAAASGKKLSIDDHWKETLLKPK